MHEVLEGAFITAGNMGLLLFLMWRQKISEDRERVEMAMGWLYTCAVMERERNALRKSQ